MDPGYSQDEILRDEQTTNAKAKLSDLTKCDLVELISHLEHEVHSRDSVINEMMKQQTREVLYQSKYGRFGVSDPFTALQRDSEKVTNDNFDHNQVKSLFDNQLQQLENLIETQRRAQATMREQKLSADERYKRVCQELDEARRKHARDTAQGDDVTVALEKEREKLQQDLAYSKNQLKKCEKEMKKCKSQLDHQTQVSNKHKQVALDVIKERRKMVAKVAESEKKNQVIAQMLQKEQEDNQKSENSKLLQLEARMEKQLMDFDIEREQYKTKLRKEENKVRDLLLQLTDIKETVLSLQQESNDTIVESGSNAAAYLADAAIAIPTCNITPVSLIKSISQTVSHNPSTLLTTSDGRLIDNSGQKGRVTSGPVLSHPNRQSTDVTSSGQPRLLHPHNPGVINSRQPAPISATSLRPASQVIVRPQGGHQAGTTNRALYYRQDAPTRTTPIMSLASVRPQSHASNVKQNSQTNKSVKPVVEATHTSTLVVQSANKSIPSRVATRSMNVSNTTQAATKSVNAQGSRLHSSTAALLTNKLSNASPQITTSTHNTATKSALSPRSITVPPHLGTSTVIDSKLGGTSTVVGNWKNSVQGGSISSTDSGNSRIGTPDTVTLLSPTDKSGMANSKPKPPPPVRNVSLPPTKKYQSIENTS